MDIAWILCAAMLVFVMQAGFLCLETGLVRSKNSINVAAKNITDFTVSSVVFWTFGFAVMFGDSFSGWIGTTNFLFGEGSSPKLIAIFLFQMMFCGTAATLVSGAIAERMSYFGYLTVTVTISALIYPIVGHWAWAGIISGNPTGWLELLGFVDFAGSTVVHSVGGWVALAAVLVIGPRIGKYDISGRQIPGSNIPMAALGGMLIWFGWFGFNGGSGLEWNDQVPSILLNTCLAAFWGGIVATALKYKSEGYIDVPGIINGVLAGLVAITASCNAVGVEAAATIGAVAGSLIFFGDNLLERLRIDDTVGVIPVHLFAGIWGTIAVAIFAETGTSFLMQLQSQLVGIGAAGLYSFFVAYFVFRVVHHFYSMRVNEKAELIGLNVSEHRVSTEVFDLLSAMNDQHQLGDFSQRVPVEPFTETGQIALQYNRVIDKVNQEIHQRDEAFAAFKKSEYRNGAILEAAMDCIITIDNKGKILDFNPAAEQCFSVGKKALINCVFFDMFMEADAAELAKKSLEMGFTLNEGLIVKRQNITELVRFDGEKFPSEIVITRTTDGHSSGEEYTLHIRDITQQQKLQKRLKLLAYNDPLTGLYNRTYFMMNLEERIRLHSKTPGAVVLMFLDLDQFKKVNDTLGHKVGDELLCDTAKRLTRLTRDVDVVGRWGGDEFLVVMSGNITIETAVKKANEILVAMRQPFTLGGNKLTVLTSIGISISENGETDADRLVQHADLAMYKAKQSGRNVYRIFNSEMEQAAQQQFRYEIALPEAMAKNQLLLHFQPKVRCDTDQVVGFEALLRWQHPDYGLISPGEFIPIIEGSNYIVEIGEWVIENVVHQLVEWRRNGYRLLPIAVNISGHHMHDPSLVVFVNDILKKNDIAGELIEIEITEGALTGNTDESIAAMAELKTTGIKLSIDDFGTGYSSLSYLKKFPVDVLKIDRAFIIECASNNEDGAICKAIISLARNLGLTIVAEGVETKEQLAFLKRYDCDIYQGYYFSRPLGSEHIPVLLG